MCTSWWMCRLWTLWWMCRLCTSRWMCTLWWMCRLCSKSFHRQLLPFNIEPEAILHIIRKLIAWINSCKKANSLLKHFEKCVCIDYLNKYIVQFRNWANISGYIQKLVLKPWLEKINPMVIVQSWQENCFLNFRNWHIILIRFSSFAEKYCITTTSLNRKNYQQRNRRRRRAGKADDSVKKFF